MHRSGTSAVAGTLQEAGLYLGSVLRKHESNRRGTREHLGIVALHDEILAYSGGSWRDPPTTIAWTDEHRARRDQIIDSFAGAGLWGFKDPRTILLLDFWREPLADSLELVGVFREPVAVASSLLRRDAGTGGEWFALWERYNAELLRERDMHTFPLVEFVSKPREFHEQVTQVIRTLGLDDARGSRFFDPRLATTGRSPAITAPPAAVNLYGRLRSVGA